MKTNKFVEELKSKSVVELKEELVAAKKELFNLRFQKMCIRDRYKELYKIKARGAFFPAFFTIPIGRGIFCLLYTSLS